MGNFGIAEYSRFDISSFEEDVLSCVSGVESSISGEELCESLYGINDRVAEFEEQETADYICHTLHMSDEIYSSRVRENVVLREKINSLVSRLCSLIYGSGSAVLCELLKDFPCIAECEEITYPGDDEIINLRQRESALLSLYNNLFHTTRVEFMGESMSMGQVSSFFENPVRSLRKKAFAAYSEFFSANEKYADEIYDELINVRSRLSLKCGYEDCTDYLLSRRKCILPKEDLKILTENVKKYIVPLRNDIYAKKAEILGINGIRYYDEMCFPGSENRNPVSGENAVNTALCALNKINMPEIIRCMGSGDLYSRKGKMRGSYCAYLPVSEKPFLFTNISGRYSDLRILLHELGHAISLTRTEGKQTDEAVSECCAYSGELILASLCTDDDAVNLYGKYILDEIISACAYAAMTYEYEKAVCDNVRMTISGRKEIYKSLQNEYMQEGRFDGKPVLENGAYWHRQAHIFREPFYYASYAAATVGALEIYSHCSDSVSAAEILRVLCSSRDNIKNTMMRITGNIYYDEKSIVNVINPVKKEFGINIPE